ncbi:MAG: YpdA family putative bacillithiol disulfide reductase [Nonlabens sp.]|uniref:YpdA family putative bacillithiol disulfide reductase n=1 Tax=Nonlabens sp. TaxID=1888209 RepID=UPI003218E8FB
MKNGKLLDVLIIGAGPIGINCALEAKKKNLSYLIIEKGPLVNSLYNYPSNMQFFSTSENLELDRIPFISKEAKPSKQEALEYYRRIATSNELNIKLFEKVESVEKVKNFKVTTDKLVYHSKNIIVATGFYDLPNKMNVKGEELKKVTHYYDDPHLYAFQNVAVIGASNSAVDAALEIYRKGGNVTMIIRGNSIGERVKYWVKPDIENRIKEGSIKAYFESEVKEILEDKIVINHDGKIIKIANDFVVALTGYRPNFRFLTSMGIDLVGEKQIPSYDEQSMETNIKGIFLAGVICGGEETHKWFIENSRVHASKIINTLLTKYKTQF